MVKSVSRDAIEARLTKKLFPADPFASNFYSNQPTIGLGVTNSVGSGFEVSG